MKFGIRPLLVYRFFLLLLIGFCTIIALVSFTTTEKPKVRRHGHQFNSTEALKREIKKITEAGKVLNRGLYGPPAPDSPIIVIKVSQNIKNLRRLLISLCNVHCIQKALLLFSHSYYDDGINDFVQQIKCARIQQIFFPHSVQLHPNKFPGPERDSQPDQTPRAANLLEEKHHWWWQANFVFRRLEWLKKTHGFVIFLNDDEEVAPDLIYMFEHLKTASLEYFTHSNLLVLGTSTDSNGEVESKNWIAEENIGLAFDAHTWKDIKNMDAYYCMNEDEQWSLGVEAALLALEKIDAVQTTKARVWKQKNAPEGEQKWFTAPVRAFITYPDPKTPRLVTIRPPSLLWSDSRDHLLCLDTLFADPSSQYDDGNDNGNSTALV